MYETDKIAILLATYNGGKYIREQIDSILNQTNQNWMVFIHDDGSSDETSIIVNQYCDEYPDKFINIKTPSTGSAKNNFFYLLNLVEAKYYMFCDQDDVWDKEKIQITYERMSNVKEKLPTMVFTDLSIVDQDLGLISNSLWDYYKFDINSVSFNSLIIRNVVTGCTVMINKELRDKMISYRNLDDVPMHDKWGALIALKFGKLVPVNCSTLMYRQHSNNQVGAKKSDGVKYYISKLQNFNTLKKQYEYIFRQSKEFVEVFDLPQNDDLYKFVQIRNKNKLLRICFYFKYGFITNRFTQILSQILWG